jgi:hypothetical protein
VQCLEQYLYEIVALDTAQINHEDTAMELILIIVVLVLLFGGGGGYYGRRRGYW